MGLVALLGDVHGNVDALDAVLADIGPRNVDEIYGLGDTVGYGPQPNECVDAFRHLGIKCVVGNHDMTSVDMLDIDRVTYEARQAFVWTNRQLTDLNKDFVYGRPTILRDKGMFLVHGSPSNPTGDYIFPEDVTENIFENVPDPILIMAHTHIPFVAYHNGGVVLNPGSVGQPRTKDKRASYALVNTDTKKAEIVRVSYDVNAVVRKIYSSGLPNSLANRLIRQDN